MVISKPSTPLLRRAAQRPESGIMSGLRHLSVLSPTRSNARRKLSACSTRSRMPLHKVAVYRFLLYNLHVPRSEGTKTLRGLLQRLLQRLEESSSIIAVARRTRRPGLVQPHAHCA